MQLRNNKQLSQISNNRGNILTSLTNGDYKLVNSEMQTMYLCKLLHPYAHLMVNNISLRLFLSFGCNSSPYHADQMVQSFDQQIPYLFKSPRILTYKASLL